jgi:hypothetical protein
MGMGVVPSEVTQAGQIDRRAILSVIHAMLYAKEPMLITQYKIVKSSLAMMLVDDYDEYKEVEEELYNALVNRRLKYVYLIYKDDDYNDFDLILISPIELNNEQLTIISEKVSLYGSILQDSYHRLAEHAELYLTLEHTISDLVTKWAGKSSIADAVLDAVTTLAREYGLDEKYVRHVYDLFCLKYRVCKGVDEA